ncbi:hypothetical protein [Pedobacter steynii]|uniref:Tetratricopeptide repeat-containing protein n=1 Tax=Pedobacter steynii TaxID=430522 RepID=A0A1D7QKH5_9SPHI|nr:hypothetical protein [Pedobacter steynii]AOM79182.1 hypothetical protein BFS30_19620 [Pedobacter steynii]
MEIKDQKIAAKLEDLIEESEGYYEEEDYEGFVKVSLKAWDILPTPKEVYDESYHLAEGLAEGYLLTGNHKESIKWAEIMGNCDMERADDGAREFILGKMLFESGDLENAKEKFALAMIKSEGRAFVSAPKKYSDLLKNK